MRIAPQCQSADAGLAPGGDKEVGGVAILRWATVPKLSKIPVPAQSDVAGEPNVIAGAGAEAALGGVVEAGPGGDVEAIGEGSTAELRDII